MSKNLPAETGLEVTTCDLPHPMSDLDLAEEFCQKCEGYKNTHKQTNLCLMRHTRCHLALLGNAVQLPAVAV